MTHFGYMILALLTFFFFFLWWLTDMYKAMEFIGISVIAYLLLLFLLTPA